MMTDDLFDDAEPEPLYGVRNKRYYFPPPPGEQPGWHNSYMRMTNLVSAFSDQKALQVWLEWKLLLGLREHDHIFDEWMAEPLADLSEADQKALAAFYADKARTAAKADQAARRGNARHLMMDTYFQRDERTGTRAMQLQLDSVLEALDKADLEVLETEFFIWHPGAGGTMGKSDARVMCRRTGQIGILDWKTQAKFWTWQEICGQLYGYDSATWQWSGPLSQVGHWSIPLWRAHLIQKDEDLGLRGRPGTELEGKRVALVAHMPQAPGPGQLPVTLKQVPLDYGREVLECAACNVELRSRGRSVKLPVQDFPA